RGGLCWRPARADHRPGIGVLPEPRIGERHLGSPNGTPMEFQWMWSGVLGTPSNVIRMLVPLFSARNAVKAGPSGGFAGLTQEVPMTVPAQHVYPLALSSTLRRRSSAPTGVPCRSRSSCRPRSSAAAASAVVYSGLLAVLALGDESERVEQQLPPPALGVRPQFRGRPPERPRGVLPQF